MHYVINALTGQNVREFSRKADATKFAKRHENLAVAASAGALALVETVDQSLEAVDAVDVDAVLASINVTGDTDTATLRERALAVAQNDVDAMLVRIRQTFEARDAFEESRGLDLADRSSSYAVARKRMLDAGQAVARAFIVLGIEPVNVIRRKVVSTNEFTAKGLDKVTELCQFICGNEVRFQSVTKAFIACAIAVADRDDSAIGNKVNKAFLSNASFDRLVSDADLATYLKDYQHKFMSGGRDTQSSQVRNVLDVLGLADIVTVDRARGGIAIKRDHGFYDLFRNRFMQTA